jgi:nucleoside-triphosphatase THEP1
VWLKAAVMGSLWASFEIIVGSFLHNLHLPFSGTTLTFASVFLVIAFLQVWKDKGLVWRAGLICALMKSLSPSAVILGPMVGIMTEALIIEFMVRIAGRNLVSYMIAGGLAVTSALVHKVISLLILYGPDLVKIFEGIYQYALKQLRVTSLEPGKLILILISLYMVAGFIAAILGYLTGRKYRAKPSQGAGAGSIDLVQRNQLFDLSGRRSYSILLLFGHLVILVLSLWLINAGRFYFFLPVSILYIAGCFFWYKKSLRYLKKISFWIQFVIITFLAAFLLEGYSSGNYFSTGGLVIGLKMNLRAFVIMVGFTAISAELKNPLIRSILYNRGFASLYQSLNLAFSALPGIISGLPKSRDFFKKRTSVLSFLFSQSELLLDHFTANYAKRPPVIMITGHVGQGKTTFLQALAAGLMSKGIKAAGFFSVGVHENNQRIGFDLEDIRTGQKMMISRNTPHEGWKNQGHYYFNTEVFQIESELLQQQIRDGADLFILDEVGPLELNDSGWSPLIVQLCHTRSSPMIWIVRRSLARRATRKWNVGNVYIFTIGEDKEEDLHVLINNLINK